MSNKEGSNFTFGDIKQEGTGHAVVDQSEGKTITVNNSGDTDAWKPLADEIESLEGDNRPEMFDAMDGLKAVVIEADEELTEEQTEEATGYLQKLGANEKTARATLALAGGIPVIGSLAKGVLNAMKELD